MLVNDADAMRALAGQVAARLHAGDVIVLSGPLGAGKTTFAQGLGAALGVTGQITSPTFVVVRTHRPATAGGLGMTHVDAYRIGADADVDDLDLDDLTGAVLVVEWGELLEGKLGDEWLQVDISRDDAADDDPAGGPRLVSLRPHGAQMTTRFQDAL